MKTLKDIFNEVYRPKSPDEQKFVDKHVVNKVADRNEVNGKPNGDDVFQAKNIKTGSRSKTRHGYDQGQDEKVYENTEDGKVRKNKDDETARKRFDGMNLANRKKYTKEDIINRTIEKYMPDAAEHTAMTPAERLVSKMEGFSEGNIHTLLGLFNSLNEDNQFRMIDKADTREGIIELIDFAINSRGSE